MEFFSIIFVIGIIIYSIIVSKRTSRELDQVPSPTNYEEEEDSKYNHNDYRFEGNECSLEGESYEMLLPEGDPEMNKAMKRSLANYQSISSVISSQGNNLNQDPVVNDYESKEKNLIASSFDLKKAVIYAEILSPKYKDL